MSPNTKVHVAADAYSFEESDLESSVVESVGVGEPAPVANLKANNNNNNDANGDDDAVDKIDHKDVDALLARELNQMTIMEREQVYEEIHGVDRRVMQEETPESIQRALIALDNELQRQINHENTTTSTTTTATTGDKSSAAVSSSSSTTTTTTATAISTKAFQQALQINPSYVQSLKLMFLRSEYFDAAAAAHRMIYFMQEKLDLFGIDVLARPVYLTDLDKESMKILKAGQYQLVPARDSTGRAILCDLHLIGKPVTYQNPLSVIKALMYTILTAVEDEETQKRGMVAVMYYVGKFTGQFDHALNKRMSKLPKFLPYRVTGFHICFDDPRLRAWKSLAMLIMGKKLRVRLRIHDGSHTEVQYSLMTFGVPVEALPVTYQGELKTAAHLKWIQRRTVKEKALKQQQQQQQPSSTLSQSTNCAGGGTVFHGIELPTRGDVILRRGRVFHDHPGNVRMRAYIDLYQPEYKAAPLGEKTTIASKIVQTIKRDGGRFLERDKDGWWVEVSDKEACKRVCKSIRSARTTLVAEQNEQKLLQQQQQHSQQQQEEQEQNEQQTQYDKKQPAQQQHQRQLELDYQDMLLEPTPLSVPQPQQYYQSGFCFFKATEDRKKRSKLNHSSYGSSSSNINNNNHNNISINTNITSMDGALESNNYNGAGGFSCFFSS